MSSRPTVISVFAGKDFRMLARCARGNVAIMFGIAIIPLFAAVGAMLDYTRIAHQRTDLQVALDTAALVGVQHVSESDAAVREAAERYVAANYSHLGPVDLDVTVSEDRTRVTVKGTTSYDTVLMRVVGIDNVAVGALAEAVSGYESLEVAIALDLTGSMRMHMAGLREGAAALVDSLMSSTAAGDQLRIALVPYVTAVNIGNDPAHLAWMDTRGLARYHGENFENVRIGDFRCDPPPPPAPPVAANPPPAANPPAANPNPPRPQPNPPAPPPAPPSSPDLGQADVPHSTVLASFLARAADMALGALVTPAQAQSGGWPYGAMTEATPVDCNRETPSPVNHFDLFNAMNVDWAGCVEARPYPYDITDEPPSAARPDTLFVPYFWPDEVDHNGTVRNDYLRDDLTMPSWVKRRDEVRQAWLWKYDGAAVVPGVMKGATPSADMVAASGPNAACPDPIVPLTNRRDVLQDAIADMRSYAGSGTNLVEGMAWAWRTVSPGEPFEAEPYDPRRHKKIIVMMTDGMNEVVPQTDNHGHPNWNRSDYGAVGYASRQRLGSNEPGGITSELDRRFAELCRNVKDQDIEIYTVMFDPGGARLPASLETMFRHCASSADSNFFKATSHAELVSSFRNIAARILSIRLSR